MTGLDDHDEPLIVTAFGASIVINGPGRLEGSLTVEAAEASAHRLMAAVFKARHGQWSTELRHPHAPVGIGSPAWEEDAEEPLTPP